MNEEQQTFIQGIDHASQNEVIVKVTGREGIDLTPHSHNRVQLVEAVAGTLRVTVGNHEYFVPEGYACWIPAGMKHALTSHNHRIALRIFYFMCDGDIDTAESFSVHYVCPWAEANFRFIADYGPSISADTDGLYNFCLSFFHTFRKEERRLVLPLRGINADTPPTLRKAMAYIHTHLADDIMLEDAAGAADISPRSLSRLFSDTDTTFSDFLRYQRIIRSLELMADNSMTIKEVAYNTGFSTPGNFNRSFKLVMGMAPSEMRRRQRA
jgi:AraC-like DNA-binding protein/quercetin dioxygenase-like cupin family protein